MNGLELAARVEASTALCTGTRLVPIRGCSAVVVLSGRSPSLSLVPVSVRERGWPGRTGRIGCIQNGAAETKMPTFQISIGTASHECEADERRGMPEREKSARSDRWVALLVRSMLADVF